MVQKLENTILGLIEDASRNLRVQPLNLGGISGTGGGQGGPAAGFIGWLVQTRVAYDETEAATLATPASGMSLVDNLNHIRYRLGTLESGILVVDDWDGTPTISGVTHLTFSGATVTEIAPHHALVAFSGGGTGTALTVETYGGGTVINNVDKITIFGATVADMGGGDVLLLASAPITVEEVDGLPSVSNIDKIIFSGAMVTNLGNGDVLVTISGGGGLDTAAGDARYLKLDASNDPVTGQLDISLTGSSNRYGVSVIVDEPDSIPAYFESDQATTMFLYNYAGFPLIFGEQIVDNNGEEAFTPAIWVSRQRNSGATGTLFSKAAIYVEDNDASGAVAFSGGTLRHTLDSSTELVYINPYTPSTGTMITFDSKNVITASGLLLTLKNNGTSKFRVTGSGIVDIAAGATYNINGVPHTHISTSLSGHILLPFGIFTDLPPFTVTNKTPFAASLDRNTTLVKWTQGYYGVAPQSGSDYWEIQLEKAITGSLDAVVATINTNQSNGWVYGSTTSFSPSNLVLGTDANIIYIRVIKHGNAGDLYLAGPTLEINV